MQSSNKVLGRVGETRVKSHKMYLLCSNACVIKTKSDIFVWGWRTTFSHHPITKLRPENDCISIKIYIKSGQSTCDFFPRPLVKSHRHWGEKSHSFISLKSKGITRTSAKIQCLCCYSHTVQPRTFKFWKNFPYVNI